MKKKIRKTNRDKREGFAKQIKTSTVEGTRSKCRKIQITLMNSLLLDNKDKNNSFRINYLLTFYEKRSIQTLNFKVFVEY